MATTGTRIYAGTGTLVTASSTIVGQGEKPDLWVLYSLDSASAGHTIWVDATADVRSVTTRRGGDTSLGRVDAGTAEVVLDNSARTYDPTANASIRPMNGWWIRSQFSGVTEDIFKGYAERYKIAFPPPGVSESLTVVSCVDEFKPLAALMLETTDPPRDNYGDLVRYDNPAGYWPLDTPDPNAGTAADPSLAAIGLDLTTVNGGAGTDTSAIVGQAIGSALSLGNDHYLTTPPLEPGQSGDAGDLDEFTVEVWIARSVNLPSATESLVAGPLNATPASTWELSMTTSGTITFAVRNAAGTNHTVTSTTVIAQAATNRWYHVVGTITTGNVRLYIDAVEEASTAFTGPVSPIVTGNTYGMTVGNKGTDIFPRVRYFDELAFYRTGMTAARISAHYTAGQERGFARLQDTGERIAALLEHHGGHAPRSIQAGNYNMAGAYMVGQPTLQEIDAAILADSGDARFFAAKDGTVTFLADGHRSSSPWNTVQATFDDDGTDLPYLTLDLDYTDVFLANEWRVTRVGGVLQTDSDATSGGVYGGRPRVPEPPTSTGDRPGRPRQPEIALTTDADASSVASTLLAKYQNPIYTFTVGVDTTIPAVTEAVLSLELGDRIRLFRTHPTAARIDQTAFVQSLEVDLVNDQGPWRIQVGVSPL